MIRITTPDIQGFETEHLHALRSLAPECMVLLKKNGDFPLTAPCDIALYGSGARDTIKGGSGSGDVNVRHPVTIEDGLENAGFIITTKAWMSAYQTAKDEAKKTFLHDISEEAKTKGKPAILLAMGRVLPEPQYDFPLDGRGEVCIYVLARVSGEGSDRTAVAGDLLLTADETRDILCCAEKYKKFMLVLNVGGPVDLSPVLERVENILLLSQLGTVTGDAFADVLLGNAYPSGKLTATWARAKDYPKIVDFTQMNDTRYREGIFTGYRYFDATGVNPLFPFGFGLGYTEFSIIATDFHVENNVIFVTAHITNTGCHAGKETVGLYYTAPDGKLAKPLRELGAYAKSQELLPGDCEKLTLQLPIEDMASWDDDQNGWLLEKGAYVISIGREPVGVVSLDADVFTQRLNSAGGTADFADWKPSIGRILPKGVPQILVHAETLAGAGHYERKRLTGRSLPFHNLSAFSDQELAMICVGKHPEGQDSSFIVGNAASRLAGGAGESADIAAAKGFGHLIMADGPAGLRLSTRYVESEGYQEGLDSGSLEIYMELLPSELRNLIQLQRLQSEEKAKTQTVLYHYASAIPIGTALAQAWNPDVPKTCGDLVGREMELFGVNVWLAPALNIHRSPLCGRNFEYYSEDPLLSGRTAAAVTLGVQAHRYCAVTIKHFVCNNQETNRFGSNSVVSQRALREIYLKGFEICMKESAPKALMTSYNLLNGIHTANRHDTLNCVLRGEWGFEGVVMTDWGTTSEKLLQGAHGASNPALCIKAGNDMIMPGTASDVNGILDGLREGLLARDELEMCAGRVLSLSELLQSYV